MTMRSALALAILGLTIVLQPGAGRAATTVAASDAFYTFRGSESSFSSSRLLADKATAIGFPGQDAISFIEFDRTALPSTLAPGQKVTLRLQHDPSLAPTLFAADAARPVSLGVYAVEDIFDPPGVGNFDVVYGPGGSAAIATASVGAPGIHSWTVTDLVRAWLADPSLGTVLALSGIYGNDGPNPRNAYGIFHAVGSSSGLAPELTITPLPAALPLLAAALGALGLTAHARRGRARAAAA